MINRAALILKYKSPAIKWINDADPHQDNPGITLKSVNKERTVYLLRDDVADTPDMLEEWLELNFEVLFEREVEDWYPDPNLWPENRTYSLFKEWFEPEFHTIIEDTVDGPIIDEDI